MTTLAHLRTLRALYVFMFVVMLLGGLLPIMRELITKNDLTPDDFKYLLDSECNPVSFIYNYRICGLSGTVWPAYSYLSLFFLLAAPLVLLNHDIRDLFSFFPAVVSCFQAFRRKILDFSISHVPIQHFEARKRQVTIAAHPHTATIAVAVHGTGKRALHFYKAEPVPRGQPGAGNIPQIYN